MSFLSDPEPLNIQSWVLEKSPVSFRLPVDSYTMRSMELNQYDIMDHMLGEMVYKLQAYVLQDKLPPKTVEQKHTYTSPKIPLTWWDMFKAEKLATYKWYWRWLARLKAPKFDVKTQEVTLKVDLERWISYPEAQDIPDTFGRQYRGYNLKSNLWD
jgi:hypothetical protein